jgi:hypothetical protein
VLGGIRLINHQGSIKNYIYRSALIYLILLKKCSSGYFAPFKVQDLPFTKEQQQVQQIFPFGFFSLLKEQVMSFMLKWHSRCIENIQGCIPPQHKQVNELCCVFV